MKKRSLGIVLALVMAFVMVIGMVPVGHVHAAEDNAFTSAKLTGLTGTNVNDVCVLLVAGGKRENRWGQTGEKQCKNGSLH